MEITSTPLQRSAFLLRTLDHFFDSRNKTALAREGALFPSIFATSCVYGAVFAYMCCTVKPHYSAGHGGTEIWFELGSGTGVTSSEKTKAKGLVKKQAVEAMAALKLNGKSIVTSGATIPASRPKLITSVSQAANNNSTAPGLAQAGDRQSTHQEGTTQTNASQAVAIPQTEAIQPPQAEKNASAASSEVKAEANPRPKPLIAMGNIAPYRRDVLTRIARNWHPKSHHGTIVLLVTIDSGGRLLDSEVYTSSGKKKDDIEALDAVRNTEFGPLPDWFKGTQLTLKIQLVSVEERG